VSVDLRVEPQFLLTPENIKQQIRNKKDRMPRISREKDFTRMEPCRSQGYSQVACIEKIWCFQLSAQP
jgi:hypothetical protein